MSSYDDLEFLRNKLKSGEYDGADIMQAWIAIEELIELHDLQERMSDILSRTAIALRGPEPELTRWSWHDLPERAAAAIAAIDVMQRAAIMASGEGD